jgi:DNA-directed RNA polymerase subunit M/transcription elongation factor TFIIS
MPLPILEAAKYTTVVPSTNETIEFRPFLVKEEKILMLAQETDDPSHIIRSLKQIIEACTFDEVDADKLTTYDLEYLFLQLRAKSVGETSEVLFKCAECEESNQVVVKLSDITVKFPEEEIKNKIELTSDIGMILRPISIGKTEELSKLKPSDDALTHSIAAVIESIYDSKGVYMADDTSEKEMGQFIDSLTHDQLHKIQHYIENQPELKELIKFKCKKCGHDNEFSVSGLSSFF